MIEQFDEEVQTLYRCLLGRAPDLAGLHHLRTHFVTGGTFREAFYALATSDEFESKRRWAGDVYNDEDSLPFVLRQSDLSGTRRLLVGFPGLATQIQVGRAEDDYRFRQFPLHRLYIGAGNDLLLGVPPRDRGLRVAERLLSRELDRLGLTPSDVITWGHSFSGTCALMLGLRMGVRRIIVGAPAVRLGSWVTYIRGQTLEDRTPLGERLFALSGLPDEVTLNELNRLVLDAAEGASSNTQVDVFIDERDSMWSEAQTLLSVLSFASTGSLHQGDYGAHEEVAEPFQRFLVERLRTAEHL